MKRRHFLAAGAALPLLSCTPRPPSRPALPPGELGGADLVLGHRLRLRDFPVPDRTRHTDTLIVGAGIGGLSAAWWLQRHGHDDFLIAELEAAAGGNARSGKNDFTRFPLGAHYLPLPGPEAAYVRLLLNDLGVLQGDPNALRPRYDERYLCHAPHERVWFDGIWEEGLLPRRGASTGEHAEFERFFSQMSELKRARDAFGRRLFALPIALASRDARWLLLDRLTMAEWLTAEGYRSPRLHWLANHACLDDYGTDYREVSAWAGLHYFACRDGLGEHSGPDMVLTAPEGNGWIVDRLGARLTDHLLTRAVCTRLEQERHRVTAEIFLADENRSIRIEARQAIWAAPLFVLPQVAETLPAWLKSLAHSDSHAPWLVANLSLTAPPADTLGAPLAWDNVLHGAPGLGYVVATHQQLRSAPAGPTVLTWYRAFPGQPEAARALLRSASHGAWAATILDELARAHADLRDLTSRIDLYRHGHAMIRPLPGVISAAARHQAASAGWGRVRFASADVSGLSLFEEANWQGVQAARRVLGGR